MQQMVHGAWFSQAVFEIVEVIHPAQVLRILLGLDVCSIDLLIAMGWQLMIDSVVVKWKPALEIALHLKLSFFLCIHIPFFSPLS